MNFIKLIIAEIKKIFLKPTILILTGLLVAVLCINGFAYNPQNKSSEVVSISGNSVAEIKSKFYSTSGTYTKANYDNIINNQTYLYITIAKSDNSQTKVDIINDLENVINKENILIQNIDDKLSDEALYVAVINVKNELQSFINKLNSELSKSAPSVIIKNKNFDALNNLFTDYKKLLNNITAASMNQEYTILSARLKSYKYLSKINNFIKSKIITVSIRNDISSEMNAFYNKCIERLELQNTVITNFENSELSIPVNNLKKEITKYIEIVEQTDTIVSSLFTSSIANNPSEYYNYTQFNKYNTKYLLTETKHLFNHELYSFSVATCFNNSTTSNTITNAYDFMFNSMQILSFVIIIFSIIIATSSIANEFSTGTIKLLLIRPFSRYKILTAKILSSLLISMLFMVVSCGFSLLIGGIMFGFQSLPILVVFNSSIAFTINPFALTLIYLLCAIIQCLIYILISILIAIIFKSSIFSVVISLCLFFAGIICNIFVSFSSWAVFLPYPNFNLFNYFLPIVSTAQIGNIFFGNYSLINIWISIVYIILVSVIVTMPAYKIFKNQDI